MNNEIQKHLNKHNIKYEHFTHIGIFTAKESEEHTSHLPGIRCKNIFLKDRDSKTYYLVTLPVTKIINMKSLQKHVGAKKLTLANEEELKNMLNSSPGHVSPFGIFYDKERKANYIIEKSVWESTTGANFHPGINTESIYVDRENFHKLIHSFEREFEILEV